MTKHNLKHFSVRLNYNNIKSGLKSISNKDEVT